MALASPTFNDSSIGLLLSFAGGATGAITATLLWMRLLRRSPELREALQVTEEGIPVAAVEEAAVEDRNESKEVEDSRREAKGVEEGP